MILFNLLNLTVLLQVHLIPNGTVLETRFSNKLRDNISIFIFERIFEFQAEKLILYLRLAALLWHVLHELGQ